MRIDRRQFLKLFSAAFVAKALGDSAFFRANSSRFESRTLGLSFAIPSRWHILDGLSALKSLEEHVLPDDPNDESVTATPLVCFTRYQESHRAMNPSACLYVDEWNDWMTESSSDFAQACFDFYTDQVPEPEVELEPTPLALRSHVWQKSIVCFDYASTSSFRHRVRMRTYLTFLRGHVVTLNLTDSAEGCERAEDEFSAIESSLTTS